MIGYFSLSLFLFFFFSHPSFSLSISLRPSLFIPLLLQFILPLLVHDVFIIFTFPSSSFPSALLFLPSLSHVQAMYLLCLHSTSDVLIFRRPKLSVMWFERMNSGIMNEVRDLFESKKDGAECSQLAPLHRCKEHAHYNKSTCPDKHYVFENNGVGIYSLAIVPCCLLLLYSSLIHVSLRHLIVIPSFNALPILQLALPQSSYKCGRRKRMKAKDVFVLDPADVTDSNVTCVWAKERMLAAAV